MLPTLLAVALAASATADLDKLCKTAEALVRQTPSTFKVERRAGWHSARRANGPGRMRSRTAR